jgi:hypothetical protein
MEAAVTSSFGCDPVSLARLVLARNDIRKYRKVFGAADLITPHLHGPIDAKRELANGTALDKSAAVVAIPMIGARNDLFFFGVPRSVQLYV